MRKVLVIGCSGSGKSTLARRLGARLKLEVIHLDAHYWRAGWVETPKDEWSVRVDELLARDAWVMDGNYSGTLPARLAACDTVVFLDVPRARCLWRVIGRTVKYRNTRRPDMAEGCRERLDLGYIEFLRWVWGYPHRTRPEVLRLLAEHEASKRVFRLRTSREVEEFLSACDAA